MKIGIIGSMQFVNQMIETQEKLTRLGHQAFFTDLHKSMIGKNADEIEKIKLDQKYNQDAIREFWNMMQGADAVLVLNYDKNGIKNYIGGNTLMEIGFAHVLNQKIFILNPIPDMPYCRTEIEAVRPIIINGDLTKITTALTTTSQIDKIINTTSQWALPILTIGSQIVLAFKYPQYGLIINLAAEPFWFYSSWKAYKQAGQIGILITTTIITLVLIAGIINYWFL